MRINLKFLKLFLVLIVGVFFLVGSGGGGGSSSDNTTSPVIEMSIKDNVVVPKDEIKVKSISTVPKNISMLIEGEIEEANELINKIVFLPPSKTIPSGFFMKVSKIEKEVDSLGKVNSKVLYTVPELDEVISELKIEEKNMLDTAKVTQIVIPTPTKISDSSLKKSYKSNDNTIMAGGKHTNGIMFGNANESIEVDYSMSKENKHIKFSFNHLELWKKENDNKLLSSLIELDGSFEFKLNEITPFADIYSKRDKYKLKFKTDFELDNKVDITMKGKMGFNFAKLLEEDSQFQCGNLKFSEEYGSTDSISASLSYRGTKWKDNICLGGVQISMGVVDVLIGNGKTSKIPLSVDIFATMNSTLEVSAEATIGLSYHQATKAELNIDITNKDPLKRLIQYNDSYDPDLYEEEGEKKPARLKIVSKGKLKGTISESCGIAFGLRIANIYPAVIEASGSLGLEGEVSSLASKDLNGHIVTEVCEKLDLTPKFLFYASVGFSFEDKFIVTSFNINEEYKKKLIYFYEYEYKFPKLVGLDTCGTYEGNVSYELKENLNGFTIKNIILDDEIKKSSFIVHDSTGKIVKEVYNKREETFNLKYGVYTFYLFIETKSGEKYLDSKVVIIKDSKNVNVEDAPSNSSFIFNTYHSKNMVLKDKFCQNTSAGGEFCIDDSLTYPIVETDNKKLKLIIEKFIQKYIGLFYRISAKEDVASMINDIGYSDTYVSDEKINLYSVTEKLVTFSDSIYSTSGGAHGNFDYKYHNYSIETGKEIFLKDIFIDGYENRLKEIAEKVYRESVNLSRNADLRDEYWFDNEFVLAESYAIGSEGLEFLYTPYEIKAFAMGFTSFTIPYSRLKSILKPNVIKNE